MGVLVAEPIADIIATLTTVTCFMVFYKKKFKDVDKTE